VRLEDDLARSKLYKESVNAAPQYEIRMQNTDFGGNLARCRCYQLGVLVAEMRTLRGRSGTGLGDLLLHILGRELRISGVAYRTTHHNVVGAVLQGLLY
jgi:hypothetical protein